MCTPAQPYSWKNRSFEISGFYSTKLLKLRNSFINAVFLFFFFLIKNLQIKIIIEMNTFLKLLLKMPLQNSLNLIQC